MLITRRSPLSGINNTIDPAMSDVINEALDGRGLPVDPERRRAFLAAETRDQREARWAARDAAYLAALSPDERAEVLARRAARAAAKAEREAKFATVRERYVAMPAWVVLAWRPGDNAPRALVEHSFSMDWSADRARMWWSGQAVDNVFGATHTLAGLEDAEEQRKYYVRRQPEWRIEVADTHDPTCPIVVDREQWARDMSGVFGFNKYGARNALFALRD